MRSLLASVAALALLSGCVVHSDDNESNHPPQPGDITFLWNFAGQSCSQEPGVQQLYITLQRAGAAQPEALPMNGYFPCTYAGIDGVKLTNFQAGSYSYTIDALDGTNNLARSIYSANGTLTVNGSVSVTVALAQVFTTGTLDVSWSFGSQQENCAEAGITGSAGVSQVRIFVDNSPYLVDCTWPSAVFEDLDPGTHQVQLEGFIGERLWYRGAGSVNVTAGSTSPLHIVLNPVASGATFIPVMAGSFAAFDCAATGSQALFIKLLDSSGNCFPTDSYGNCGYSDSCSAFATAGFYFDYLLADDGFDSNLSARYGDWTVVIEGWDSVSPQVHNVVYSGSQVSRVQAGLADQQFRIATQRR